MNLCINRLPARTWNRLGMNETKLVMEGNFENHTPAAGELDPAASWDPCTEAFSGVSGDLDALTENACTGLLETKTGAVMQTPLLLHYAYRNQEQAVSRLTFHAGPRSHLKVILLLESQGSGDVSAIQIKTLAEENAKIDIYVAQLLDQSSVCLQNVSGVCHESARVSLTRLELGAGKLYAGANLDLLGDESEFVTDIGYHCKADQLLDMNYVALHHGKNTNSLMEVSGTLEDGARKIFRGTIDFQQGCAGAKGTENENVLLLGDNMVNQTIPLILCKEEDVEGNHGASIGRLDEKVLFYLGSRGISEAQAQQIIAEARIEAVCSQIPSEAVQTRVREFESKRGLLHEPQF